MFGRWQPFLIVGGALQIAGLYLLSTIHYDTNFAFVFLYMFLLGAGVGMTMPNLVPVVQNTTEPSKIGVGSSDVTFFCSLGTDAQRWSDQLCSGTIPQVSAMPQSLRVVFEDIYAQGISHPFLIAVPFAVVS